MDILIINAFIPPGLWIRIHFLQIRIHLFFSMRIRIQSSSLKNADPDPA